MYSIPWITQNILCFAYLYSLKCRLSLFENLIAFLWILLGQKMHDKKTFEPMPSRRYMGITMLTLTDDILTELRQRSHTVPVDVKSGVLIWKVIIGSPAYK